MTATSPGGRAEIILFTTVVLPEPVPPAMPMTNMEIYVWGG